MTSEIRIEPRYQETDKMGIIHHSVYAVWYEMGRIRMMEELGHRFDALEKEGLGLAITGLESTYIRPAVFGQSYVLSTTLKEVTHVRMTFSHTLLDADGRVVNQGHTMVAWVDRAMRPVSVRKTHPALHDLLVRSLKR
jgi:acyl-CoA thioester hydrolase